MASSIPLPMHQREDRSSQELPQGQGMPGQRFYCKDSKSSLSDSNNGILLSRFARHRNERHPIDQVRRQGLRAVKASLRELASFTEDPEMLYYRSFKSRRYLFVGGGRLWSGAVGEGRAWVLRYWVSPEACVKDITWEDLKEKLMQVWRSAVQRTLSQILNIAQHHPDREYYRKANGATRKKTQDPVELAALCEEARNVEIRFCIRSSSTMKDLHESNQALTDRTAIKVLSLPKRSGTASNGGERFWHDAFQRKQYCLSTCRSQLIGAANCMGTPSIRLSLPEPTMSREEVDPIWVKLADTPDTLCSANVNEKL